MKVKRPIYTEATEHEVKKRLHPWAVAELTAEALKGFPLVKRINGKAALVLVDMALLYDGERRVEFIRAFLENPYGRTLEAEGIKKSALASEILDAFMKRLDITYFFNKNAKVEMENYIEDPEPFNLSRQDMVGAVRDLIVKMDLGTKVKVGEGDTVGFDYYYGNWRIYTGVIIRAGKTNHMDFAHCVYDENGARLLVSTYPSILGMGDGAQWNLLRKADLPEAVETLGLLTKKFYEVVSTIVEGIPQDYRMDL